MRKSPSDVARSAWFLGHGGMQGGRSSLAALCLNGVEGFVSKKAVSWVSNLSVCASQMLSAF